MTRHICFALVLMAILLGILSWVQDVDERIEAGEFQRIAMQEQK